MIEFSYLIVVTICVSHSHSVPDDLSFGKKQVDNRPFPSRCSYKIFLFTFVNFLPFQNIILRFQRPFMHVTSYTHFLTFSGL